MSEIFAQEEEMAKKDVNLCTIRVTLFDKCTLKSWLSQVGDKPLIKIYDLIYNLVLALFDKLKLTDEGVGYLNRLCYLKGQAYKKVDDLLEKKIKCDLSVHCSIVSYLEELYREITTTTILNFDEILKYIRDVYDSWNFKLVNQRKLGFLFSKSSYSMEEVLLMLEPFGCKYIFTDSLRLIAPEKVLANPKKANRKLPLFGFFVRFSSEDPKHFVVVYKSQNDDGKEVVEKMKVKTESSLAEFLKYKFEDNCYYNVFI
jgi:hypothetical protein